MSERIRAGQIVLQSEIGKKVLGSAHHCAIVGLSATIFRQYAADWDCERDVLDLVTSFVADRQVWIPLCSRSTLKQLCPARQDYLESANSVVKTGI
jgi:phenylalanine-4-hydroxylase